jgi:hypothetical protein
MIENVGTYDRVFRVVLGTGLIALALGWFPGYQTGWGWVGLVPLVTGIVGSCPVYSVLGLNTCGTTR